jgi:AraC-like DNA-binding protein
MKISVETLSHPSLQFPQVLPDRFTGERLSGAEILSVAGSFGSVCIQEFYNADFILRYSVIQTREEFRMRARSLCNGLHGIILLRGNFDAGMLNEKSFKINEGQFTFIHAMQPETIIVFQEKQQYIFFEVLLSDLFAVELVSDFHDFSLNFSKQAPEVWVNPPQYIDEEVKDHIRYVLNYSDNPAWRRNYYENQAWHIAWKLLAIYGHTHLDKDAMTAEERQIAHTVAQSIGGNLEKHLLVRELAKKAGISQSRLKSIFNKVYGTGIHEYRIQQRLKKAIDLIHAGKLVKEAAAMTGWRSANLIRAYRKIYGTTPGTMKGKKK